MANNKTFKIKNGLQAGRYLGSNGTKTAGTNGPYGTFSTDLYTGNGATQTITNGIDLSGEGGLTWIKIRDGFNSPLGHHLYDTARGATKKLSSNNTDAESTVSTGLTAFNSNGFSLGSNVGVNGGGTGDSYVSWTFKKATKFFDVVTYTGDGTTEDGSSRLISHNLGSTPGFYIVKRTDGAENWRCFHRSLGATKAIQLNGTGSAITASSWWADVEPTDTNFSVTFNFNATGANYVVYLFAHDTASDSQIKCGSYTGTSSSIDINLGWEPQWLLIKRSDSAEDWSIVDNVRGMGTDPLLTGLKALTPNTSSAEESPT